MGCAFLASRGGLFRYTERYLSHQVTFRLLARLRVWFYQALEPLAPARLMAFRSGDLLARLMGDIESLENFYVRVISPPAVALLVAVLSYTILARFDPSLGWVLLIFLFLSGVGLSSLAWFLGRKPGIAMVRHKANLSAAILDGLQGMPELAAHNQQARHAELIFRQNENLILAQRRFQRLSALQIALSGLLSQAGMWSVLVLAIPLVESGRMEGIYLAVVSLAALTSFEAVAPLPMAAQYLGANLQAAQRLMQVVDARAEVLDPPQLEVAFPATSVTNPAALQVQAVSFTYPQDRMAGETESQDGSLPGNTPIPYQPAVGSPVRKPESVLDGISFDLPFGKRLAIVGTSGAGKSTVLNLLLRFWDFQEGQITLGGVDIRRLTMETVRSQMAVISQSTYLFSASLRDNLRIARVNASQAEIEQAAEQAGLKEFIDQLPQGYDTWIGEHGLRLSGGERQRLAIARALLKNSPLLILDEATANLDSVTEKQILETIFSRAQQGSVLMISHRLVAMQAMHEILVLDQGRVTARGQHADLMAAGGLYRRMWDIQHGWLVSDV